MGMGTLASPCSPRSPGPAKQHSSAAPAAGAGTAGDSCCEALGQEGAPAGDGATRKVEGGQGEVASTESRQAGARGPPTCTQDLVLPPPGTPHALVQRPPHFRSRDFTPPLEGPNILILPFLSAQMPLSPRNLPVPSRGNTPALGELPPHRGPLTLGFSVLSVTRL